MNQEFLRPRLVGRRFDEHTLPLDLLKDFSALEELLIEVAKRQYLTAHRDRQRTPKGFTKGLELHLTAVEEGSAIPVIALAFATATLFPTADAAYFDQAKDQIVEAIAAAEHGQQPVLPPELLRYFDRFGRGLHEGESMEFARSNGQTTALTPATRQYLLRASQAETWTEEVTLKGRIPEVDQADHSFELELRNGVKLKAPLLEAHRNTVLEAAVGYRSGAAVAIKGVIERDRADRPKRFEAVEHVTSLDPLDIETRLEELLQLQDGWLNGKGKALGKDSLQRLSEAFERWFAADLPLPHLYPTPEGGVQAEWSLGNIEVSLEFSFPSLNAALQIVDITTGESQDHDLPLGAEERSWVVVNDKIKAMQESQT